MIVQRRLPIGAEVLPGGGVSVRIWAPRVAGVEIVLEAGPGAGVCARLLEDANGYFTGDVSAADTGTRYRFRLDGREPLYPDPASRFQPEGPHGASEVVDPSTFEWTDAGWAGVTLERQVLYEMHIGTFTPEGTWAAALRELPELASAGLTVLEVMPVAEFPGRFGWGYDGVDLFAPSHLYGVPDDFRRFVDRAHALGLAVILDVVYNHLGPDGNYLGEFAREYFTDRYETDWGRPFNFDGQRSGPVREFVVANAGYWIEEFHLDGLRLDATQSIHDRSPEHILIAISRRVRAAAHGRGTIVVAENEPQEVRLLQPVEAGGYGIDALWNDDFHHSAMVALTGRHEAYYSDYRGTPQELISAAKRAFLYQGQWYSWQRQRRGTPTDGIAPARFVAFMQNHDQIANSARGERCHRLTSPGRHRAMTAVLLLMPATPMLFQGQEYSASSPFLYFADHEPELATLVHEGRVRFLRQFPSIGSQEAVALIPDPADPETYRRCKLDPRERRRHAGAYALHRDLLTLRRTDPVFRAQASGGIDGAVLGPGALVLRFFGPFGDDRLLLVNLAADLALGVVPEPLLAPPAGHAWRIIWSSEDPRYGGRGTLPIHETAWQIPGEAAVLLAGSESSP
jgi:maltooligosyltrehalose trehalohydrolase